MRLLDVVIFSLCVVLFIIGVWETITLGLGSSYWLFMFSVGLLFLYQLRKMKQPKNTEDPPPSKSGRIKTKGAKK